MHHTPNIPAIDGGWSVWTSWSTCTKLCGGGLKWKNRTCTNPTPLHGGQDCAGDTSAVEDCNTHSCRKFTEKEITR